MGGDTLLVKFFPSVLNTIKNIAMADNKIYFFILVHANSYDIMLFSSAVCTFLYI